MNAKVEHPKSILKNPEQESVSIRGAKIKKKGVTFGAEESKEFYKDKAPNALEEGVYTKEIEQSSGSMIYREMIEKDKKTIEEFLRHLGGIAPLKESPSKSSTGQETLNEIQRFVQSIARLVAKFDSQDGKRRPKRLSEFCDRGEKDSKRALEPVNREAEYVGFFRMLDEKGIGFSDLAKNNLTQKGAGIRLHLPMNLLNRQNIDVQGMAEIALAAKNLGLIVTKRVSGGKPDGFEFSMNPQSALRAYNELKAQSQSTEQIERCEREIKTIEKQIEFHQKSCPTYMPPQSNRLGLEEDELPKPIKKVSNTPSKNQEKTTITAPVTPPREPLRKKGLGV